MIAYSKILKQAYAMMRTHTYLWVLGLFLFWDLGFNFLAYMGRGNGVGLNSEFFSRVGPFKLLLGLFLSVVFLQLNFRGKTAIIIGTKNIIEKKPMSFRQAYRASKGFYLRVFGVWFSTVFLLVLATAALSSPIIYLLSINYSGRAAILGMLALFIFIPLAILVNFLNNLAPMFIVFYDLRIGQAVDASFDMIKKFWINLLSFSLWLGALTGLVTYVMIILWDVGVVILGHLFYNVGRFHLTFVTALLSLAAIGTFLIFAGWVSAFQQICWTLLFKDMVRPQKFEQEEAVPVPEII